MACGGIIRDFKSRHLRPFSCGLVPCSILKSKLWAIINGIRLSLAKDFRKILVESNSKNVVELVKRGVASNRSRGQLVLMVHRLKEEIEDFRLSRVMCEGNVVAASLAKHDLLFLS